MPRILVVDDLLSDRCIVAGLLAKVPELSVEQASNGVDALEKMSRQVPDLVLTDLQMPQMNGLELVQQIRQVYPLVPAILMTAKGSEDIAVQALQQGATSYVPKRHLAVDLLQTIHRVLAASTEERSYARLRGCVAETTLILENDLMLLSAFVSQVRNDLEQRRICVGNDAIRVVTALDEALLNAYYHGNLEVDSALKSESFDKFYDLANRRLKERPYCDRRITVTVGYLPSEVRIMIRDDGRGFNPDDLPDPTDLANLDRPSGRGMLLMRSFLDKIIFNDVGNEVTLVKRCSQVA